MVHTYDTIYNRHYSELSTSHTIWDKMKVRRDMVIKYLYFCTIYGDKEYRRGLKLLCEIEKYFDG